MDNLTHTLVGAALGAAFYRPRLGERAVPVLALASNLPDIDGIVLLAGGAMGVTMRRTFGHSLLLVPVWSAALAWGLRSWRWRDLGFSTLYRPILVGALLHLAFDLINSFGVLLLWPLSGWRPEISIVFIIDLALTALLAWPWLLGRLPPLRRSLEGMTRVSLALTAAYLLACASLRSSALVALTAASGKLGVRPDFIYAFPEPLGPHRWRGVVRARGIYRLYLVNALTGSVEPRGEVETYENDPRVRLARATEPGRRLDAFFKAPVWSLRTAVFGRAGNDPVEVSVRDLRFLSLLLERRTPFQYSFLVYPSGRVEAL